MMIQVTELLKKRTDITAWRVTEQRRTSYEAFFIRRDLETVRTTDTCDTSVTIYLDHDDFTGDASFTVYASTDEAAFERKLNAAIERAGMINNRRYTLPTADTLSRELPSGFAAAPMSELYAKVAQL